MLKIKTIIGIRILIKKNIDYLYEDGWVKPKQTLSQYKIKSCNITIYEIKILLVYNYSRLQHFCVADKNPCLHLYSFDFLKIITSKT